MSNYFCGLLMHSQKYHPSMLTGAMLDAFLARGWFRMGQAVFTTHYLRFQQQFYPAVWLRYGLTIGQLPLIESKLRKVEKKLKVQISPWLLDEEQESLFTIYREHSGLAMSPSLREILLGEHSNNIFETWQVAVRDGERLIGLGIFDLGEHAAAGIINIYHPEFKHFSLGKMLMYLKIRYCLRLGYSWFYPGYAVPGYKKFDYKLEFFSHQIEYYHAPFESWLPYHPKAGLPNFLEQLQAPLESLIGRLRAANINGRLVYYPGFDLALADDKLPEVLSAPVFLLLAYEDVTEKSTIVVYDLEKEGFRIMNCRPFHKNGWAFEGSKCICFDLMQVIDRSENIFKEKEIMKIMGTG